jgi:hypothetical protein
MLCIRSLFFYRKRYKSQFRIYVDSWHRIVSFCDPLCALCEWCDQQTPYDFVSDSFGHFFIPHVVLPCCNLRRSWQQPNTWKIPQFPDSIFHFPYPAYGENDSSTWNIRSLCASRTFPFAVSLLSTYAMELSCRRKTRLNIEASGKRNRFLLNYQKGLKKLCLSALVRIPSRTNWKIITPNGMSNVARLVGISFNYFSDPALEISTSMGDYSLAIIKYKYSICS